MKALTFSEYLSLAFHLKTAADAYRADAIKVGSHAAELPTTKQMVDQFHKQAAECDHWSVKFERAAHSAR